MKTTNILLLFLVILIGIESIAGTIEPKQEKQYVVSCTATGRGVEPLTYTFSENVDLSLAEKRTITDCEKVSKGICISLGCNKVEKQNKE